MESDARGYSGRFNVRIAPGLHQRLADGADRAGLSLNRFVEKLLTSGLERAASAGGHGPDRVSPLSPFPGGTTELADPDGLVDVDEGRNGGAAFIVNPRGAVHSVDAASAAQLLEEGFRPATRDEIDAWHREQGLEPPPAA